MDEHGSTDESLSSLGRQLLEWYERHGRTLPWRQTRDPYAIWVAEIMLQQTRVEAAIPYYQQFLARFPTMQALAESSLEQVLKAWEGLGYYARARNLHRAARLVMAEMGGGPEEQPPMGYVEPNPEAYARLLALAEMTRDGLESRTLLDDVTRGNLDNLIEELEFLLDVAQKELNGETLTDEEYWRIQYFGGWLEAMTIAAADPADTYEGRGYLEDQKSAVIADVATGVGRVLEEGVGYPTKIFVVLPTAPYQVAVGAVYTYYEFTVEPQNRMTDEDWRTMLESGNAPAAPDWTSSFIVP